MDWWILKQLRVQALSDIGTLIDPAEFENVPAQLTVPQNFANHQHFTRELKWGYAATVLGKKLFYSPPPGMTARQLSASEVIMHLGMLTSAETQHSMLGQIAENEKDSHPKSNAAAVRDQLGREHIPTFLDNLHGALTQYLKYLPDLESAPFADLVKNGVKSRALKSADSTEQVDITKHIFDVAFSFPGEVRSLVKEIADEIEKKLGRDSYFYDNNYVAQIARPNADLLLQNIYSKQSRLVVVFICAEYDVKKWCGVEFRAIRQLLFDRTDKIMLIRAGAGEVQGIFQLDGYIDANAHTPQEIAQQIETRVKLAGLSNE